MKKIKNEINKNRRYYDLYIKINYVLNIIVKENLRSIVFLEIEMRWYQSKKVLFKSYIRNVLL